MSVHDMMQLVFQVNASDLHLVVGAPPVIRVDGVLSPIEGEAVLMPDRAQELIYGILTDRQRELLIANKEVDYSYQFSEVGRFRVNAYYQRLTLAAALRLIPTKVPTLEELRIPGNIRQFTNLRQGFILVTGPTGHGKSTTLAALIEIINQERADHIVTIEDPLEFLFQSKQSVISQRELHGDTHSWQVALRSALREDPNVVMVGEMRDYETIAAALSVAETGHLVFSTLHTNSAAQTIDRIIDVFPEHQQAQVRLQLSNTLEAVVSMRLIPAKSGGRIPAVEILLATPAVRNIIRVGKTHQIDNVIQTSGEIGMMSMEACLAYWTKAGELDLTTAQQYSLRPEEVARLVKGSP
ncbi:type IV pili twitching motility protein PilT [Microgenomates group bacterium RBG_16_45_19]|nr:MAG: type IV pili twitching motility protein PilT [Microgenomates group bacterium RBG_16_45_19]